MASLFYIYIYIIFSYIYIYLCNVECKMMYYVPFALSQLIETEMVAYASSNQACGMFIQLGNWRHLGEQAMRSGQSGHGMRDDRFWR